MSLWKNECMRVISDRFVSIDDEAWYVKIINRMVSEEISEEIAQSIEEPLYFVDFLRYNIEVLLFDYKLYDRDAPEPTGEEGEDFDFSAPKIYEPVYLKIFFQ